MIVEIVDAEAKIRAFLPTLQGLLDGGLVTMEKVEVLKYGSDA